MQDNTFPKAALAYANAGFHVFPLMPKQKIPMTSNGFKDATRDVKKITEWWSKRPDANIGVATGKISGIFVVDIDGPCSDAVKALFPAAFTVKSSKGGHYYFKYPDNEDIANTIKIGGLPIDVKSDGGYIVAAPSVHPTGVKYEPISNHIYPTSPDILSFIRKKYDINMPSSGFPTSGFRNEHIEGMLSCLDPNMGYDDWIKVGMSLHSDNRDIDLWINWSAKGSKFRKGECEKKWKGFSRTRDNSVTMGTLVNMAQNNGYQSPYQSSIKRYDEVTPPPPANDNQIKMYRWSELRSLPPRKYLIKSLIYKNDLSMIYGPSNSGKTFVALDMALHISLGRNWCSKKVQKGSVVYIAAEGGLSIRERLEAFRNHHNLKEYSDIYFIPSTVPLNKAQSMHQELLQELKTINDIQFIIIDTLARAMGTCDENVSGDMGAFIANCDLIRKEIGAHVMIVHHAGKDISRGARGHSSLKAAIDTEIEISQSDGIIKAKIIKQRDGEVGHVFNFKLEKYMVGKDEDGDPISSCALAATDQVESKVNLAEQTKKIFELIKNLIALKPVTFQAGHEEKVGIPIASLKEALIKSGIIDSDKPDSVNKALKRAKEQLIEAGYIEEINGYICLVDK